MGTANVLRGLAGAGRYMHENGLIGGDITTHVRQQGGYEGCGVDFPVRRMNAREGDSGGG